MWWSRWHLLPHALPSMICLSCWADSRVGCRVTVSTPQCATRAMGPVPAIHARKAVDTQQGDPASMLEHYRRFLAFRRSFPAFAKGNIEFLAADGDTLAFARQEGNERIVCAFNLGHKQASVDLGSDAKLSPIEGHGFEASARPRAKWTSVILHQEFSVRFTPDPSTYRRIGVLQVADAPSASAEALWRRSVEPAPVSGGCAARSSASSRFS